MAGISARKEFERIRDERHGRRREQRTRLLVGGGLAAVTAGVASQVVYDSWLFGALLAAVLVASRLGPSQREVAWRKGAEGEELVAGRLESLGGGSIALHDRRIPRSRANIDHLLVTPHAVWTIDAKNYSGKIETRRRGRELWVNGRNRSKLLDQARRQRNVVAEALHAAGHDDVPVHAALCFMGVEWPLLFRPRAVGDVSLVSPRTLSGLLGARDTGTRSPVPMSAVARVLEEALAPAGD